MNTSLLTQDPNPLPHSAILSHRVSIFLLATKATAVWLISPLSTYQAPDLCQTLFVALETLSHIERDSCCLYRFQWFRFSRYNCYPEHRPQSAGQDRELSWEQGGLLVRAGFQIKGEKKKKTNLSCRNVQDCPLTVWDRVLEHHQLKWGSIATLWRTQRAGFTRRWCDVTLEGGGRSGCRNGASFGSILPIHQGALSIACTPLPPALVCMSCPLLESWGTSILAVLLGYRHLVLAPPASPQSHTLTPQSPANLQRLLPPSRGSMWRGPKTVLRWSCSRSSPQWVESLSTADTPWGKMGLIQLSN